MIKGEHAELTKIAEVNVCAECGALLSVATHQESGVFAIRCGNGHWPDAVKRAPTLAQRSKQGEALPATATYSRLPDTDLGTGGKLSAQQVSALCNYAMSLSLRPELGHVMLMYGRPYIGLDGYIFYAKRCRLPYTLRSRPMTPAEREANQLVPGDHGWISELERLDDQSYAMGVGVVTLSEMSATSDKRPGQLRSPVVAAHPWQLAQKRAEWQAFRRVFPLGDGEPSEGEKRG